MPRKPKPALSELENDVMAIVWSHGQVTAENVRTGLEPDRPLKDSTIRTVLRRLEEKGYVGHVADGRTYVYSPTVASHSVAADAVRGIIERFCNGSVEDLLVGLVNRDVVSPHKLTELAQRIAESRQKAPKKKRQRRKGK